jgi:hypothetical protein
LPPPADSLASTGISWGLAFRFVLTVQTVLLACELRADEEL